PAQVVTTAVAVCVTPTTGIAADAVSVSATVELSVPVATPLALVGPVGCVRVLPVPVAASTTVAPAIGFLNPSWAVTVIVEVALPDRTSVVEATGVEHAEVPPSAHETHGG